MRFQISDLIERSQHILEEGSGAGDPNDLLFTDEVSAWFRISTAWLEVGRHRDYGPPFVKIKGMVRYRRGDVIDWLRQISTKPRTPVPIPAAVLREREKRKRRA